MSSTLIFVGLPEDSKSSISKIPSTSASADLQTVELEDFRACSNTATNRVPNAPKSCIAEIFSADTTDSSPVKNGNVRPRVVRDTPTRPRDTHSRLFGQMNGGSPAHSPSKMTNGSATSTPSRASYSPPKRNPVTGDGVQLPPPRRRHPAASLREGNPITGDGYKSMNGQINTVTSVCGSSHRVPPGGFSSGLW